MLRVLFIYQSAETTPSHPSLLQAKIIVEARAEIQIPVDSL
jgi:hypothetical protein